MFATLEFAETEFVNAYLIAARRRASAAPHESTDGSYQLVGFGLTVIVHSAKDAVVRVVIE